MARWACTFQLMFLVIVSTSIHCLDRDAEPASASCSDEEGIACTSNDHSSIAGSLEKKNHESQCVIDQN